MEKFDIKEYMKRVYKVSYPFDANAQLPLNVPKIEHLLKEIHEHYEDQVPVDEPQKEYEEPVLVDEDYSFKPKEEAEVRDLHGTDDKRQAVLRRFRDLIGSEKHILCYYDNEDGANYAIGNLDTKDLLYLQYVLNLQISMQLQRSSLEV